MAKNFQEYSKDSWVTEHGGTPNMEQVQVGCLQRIAKSLENIEQPYLKLLADRQMYERFYRELVAKSAKKDKQIAAYRGIINRMKKQRVK